MQKTSVAEVLLRLDHACHDDLPIQAAALLWLKYDYINSKRNPGSRTGCCIGHIIKCQQWHSVTWYIRADGRSATSSAQDPVAITVTTFGLVPALLKRFSQLAPLSEKVRKRHFLSLNLFAGCMKTALMAGINFLLEMYPLFFSAKLSEERKWKLVTFEKASYAKCSARAVSVSPNLVRAKLISGWTRRASPSNPNISLIQVP